MPLTLTRYDLLKSGVNVSQYNVCILKPFYPLLFFVVVVVISSLKRLRGLRYVNLELMLVSNGLS